MKTLNRVLLSLVLAVGVAVVWSWVSRTPWAESVSLLGVGEAYDNALQPLVKVAAAIIVMVASTQLIQRAADLFLRRFVGLWATDIRKNGF